MRKRKMWKTWNVNRKNMKNILLLLVFISLVLGPYSSVTPAPTSELWPYWNTLQGNLQKKINHVDWDLFLKKYWVKIDAANSAIDYQSVNANDKKALELYIKKLEEIPIRQYRRDEQLAYWLNLYNAATVWLVLEYAPKNSIREIKFSLFAFGPWSHRWISVEGKKLSLDDIEHRILRPIWNTPLIHYGVNCASKGCPPILSQAFRADSVKSMLGRAEKIFVRNKAWRFKDNQLLVSSIYDWFAQDFGGKENILEYLAGHSTKDDAAMLTAYDGTIKYEYDWSLNQP